jgi:hypothetical protein
MSPELQPIKCAATAALWLVSGLTAVDAFAQAGGQPLILDTQTGIHSGAGGAVLQTAPMNGSGLVPAPPMATLPELPQQDQQTIVVSPYIELPQGGHSGVQGYGSSTGPQSLPHNYRYRPRSMSPHSGGSYGVPTGTQTQAQAQAQTQPALPQTPQSSIVTSVLIAAPKSVATPKPAATAPSRSPNPHSATGTVTTSLD